jgi:16S rRNA (uracil1498-N3)-methyltransferase
VPLKGDRTELVVQKATEIGISEIVIVEPTARSVVRWDERKQKSEMQRLGRIAREASMQSRRVFLPHVTGPKPIKELAGDGFSVAEPGATGIFSGLSVLIGPEGGFTEEELGLFNDSVDLGQTILRAETAAIVASALVMANAKRVIQ